MYVLKFGGTSLGSAPRLLGALDIIAARAAQTRVGVIVSAVSGITNLLIAASAQALAGAEISTITAPFRQRHAEILAELAAQEPRLPQGDLSAMIAHHTAELTDLLRGSQLLGVCPPDVYARVLSPGERVSVRLMRYLPRAASKLLCSTAATTSARAALRKSGDQLMGSSGILSGSLSFIFGLLEDGVPFSEAVTEARNRGFTEPDPRDDLSGLDVARKLLILHREASGQQELTQVEIASIFPPWFDATGPVDDFMHRLPELDAHF